MTVMSSRLSDLPVESGILLLLGVVFNDTDEPVTSHQDELSGQICTLSFYLIYTSKKHLKCPLSDSGILCCSAPTVGGDILF